MTEEMRDERELEQSTIEEARHRLNPLIRLAPNLLSAVTDEHIRERLGQLTAAASKKGTLTRMRDFFNYAVGAGLVKANPCDGIVVKAKAKRGKTTLTRAEAKVLDAYLWEAADGTGADATIAAAVLVLLYLGLRRAELLRLQVRDLDLDGTAVVSVERRAKSRRAFRDMEAPERIAALLARLVEGREMTDWLWPSPKAASGHRGGTWLLKGVKRMCTQAGVSPVCPQGLRATHSKLARTAGMTAHAIQAQLGHEDVRTSVESYIGADVDARERTRKVQSALRSELG